MKWMDTGREGHGTSRERLTDTLKHTDTHTNTHTQTHTHETEASEKGWVCM